MPCCFIILRGNYDLTVERCTIHDSTCFITILQCKVSIIAEHGFGLGVVNKRVWANLGGDLLIRKEERVSLLAGWFMVIDNFFRGDRCMFCETFPTSIFY